MLEVNVKSVSGQVVVQIPSADKLTPQTAKDAAEIAFGVAAYCDVWNDQAAYRVTKTVRKISRE